MNSSHACAYALAFVITSLGCTSSSSKFGDILDDGSGGTGTASISITTYSPGSASVVIKESATQLFVVSATGDGTLLYTWTLDGVTVGTNSPSFTLNANLYSVGNKVLRVTVHDSVGSAYQEWNVKINGTPVITSSTPSTSTVHVRRSTSISYSLTLTDPNSDTLTYVWKLDGQEGILTGASTIATWSPTSVDVGSHQIAVDVYDGPQSDAGTYKVTRTWTTLVNHFSTSCNTLENENQTNKTCLLVGIPGIGDGLNPLSDASAFYMRPAAVEVLANGNMFIADDMNHVIWYWNRASSPSTTVLGTVVPVDQMKVVAGVGMASSGNSASTKATRTFLNTPHGIYWDGTYLYISDTSNNRGLRVDSSGDVTSIFTASCSSPRGVIKVGSYIYFACYSSNIVRRYDATTFAATTYAGTGAAANPPDLTESTFTDATRGMLNGPYGLAADASGNIYVGEYTGCRIRFYNNTVGALIKYGTYSISSNRQRILVGAAGAPNCGVTSGEAIDLTAAANAVIGNVRLMSFNSAGELLFGQDNDKVGVLNMAAAASSILGVTLNAYWATHALGSGTASYNGNGAVHTATHFNNPFQIQRDPSTGDYYVADYSNNRFRKINLSDNKVELIAGNGGQRHQTNAGQGTLESGQEKMNAIRGIAYDSYSGDVIVSDGGNNRIRAISKFGVVSQLVGTGSSGTGSEEDEYPTNSTMNTPRGVVLTHSSASFGGHAVWADSANHRIRIFNRSGSSASLFGVTVASGRVATIGGNGVAGNATSGSALTAAFNTPSGLAYDGTDLYVADMSNHCIKKLSSTGILSVIAGTCGTSGNVNGPAGVGQLNSPEGIDYFNSGSHTGLLIADRGNSRVKFLRFAGSSLLFGTSISAGDANTVACGGTFHTEGVIASLSPCSSVYDVTAVGSGFCFVNFGYHNVRCVASGGAITTAMGTLQGIDDTTPLYFPGVPLADGDYDATTNPNPRSQNGITAFNPPSPLAAPLLSDVFGQLTYPIPIRALNSSTILVGEHYMGFIRKVKLP